MKQLDDLLLRLERDAKFISVICPVCEKPWDAVITLPDFDGICPSCHDDGARPGNFRRSLNRARDRDGFLQVTGFPSICATPFQDRPGEAGKPARLALAWDGNPWCIGLVGISNVGKTMVAAELSWRLRERFPVQRFIRADRLVSAFYGRLGKEVAEETYEQTTRAEVLILDDLGWGNKGGAMDAVFEVLAQRHGDGRPTIWTSNTEPHELAQTNAPMLRRLAEGRIVRFDKRSEWNV